MSRGYLVIAQNTNKVDYLRLTYALALSLKATQNENSICVAVDETTKSLVTDKHNEVFDYVVDIPGNDSAKNERWKIHNKWKYLQFSPYDSSVILDSDMLFSVSVDNWWEILERQDMLLCSDVKTYRNEPVTSTFYRERFITNELPNIYSNCSYFSRGDISEEFFRLSEIIMSDWETYRDKLLVGTGQTHLSADLVYAMVTKLLNIENDITTDNEYPTFVHMKPMVQNIDNINNDWTQTLSNEVTADLNIRIENFIQYHPFHYVEKHWMTDEIIRKYEKALGI